MENKKCGGFAQQKAMSKSVKVTQCFNVVSQASVTKNQEILCEAIISLSYNHIHAPGI